MSLVTATSGPVTKRAGRALDLSAIATPAPSLPAIAVIVPTYNEVENLPGLHRSLRRAVPEAALVIVDDNSPDGTGDLAERLVHDDPFVWVLHRRQKGGLGRAYVAGMTWALMHGAEIVVEMDADGSHSAAQVKDLLRVIAEGADLAVGSRYVAGGRTVGWARRRSALSRAGNAYAGAMLSIHVRDCTSGFRAYRRECLQALGLASVKSQGYCFQIEMTKRAVEAACTVVEVPITFAERELGQSKMSWRVTAEALGRVSVWGLKRRLRRQSLQEAWRGGLVMDDTGMAMLPGQCGP